MWMIIKLVLGLKQPSLDWSTHGFQCSLEILYRLPNIMGRILSMFSSMRLRMYSLFQKYRARSATCEDTRPKRLQSESHVSPRGRLMTDFDFLPNSLRSWKRKQKPLSRHESTRDAMAISDVTSCLNKFPSHLRVKIMVAISTAQGKCTLGKIIMFREVLMLFGLLSVINVRDKARRGVRNQELMDNAKARRVRGAASSHLLYTMVTYQIK